MIFNGSQAASSGPSGPTKEFLSALGVISSVQLFSFMVLSRYDVPGVLRGVRGSPIDFL